MLKGIFIGSGFILPGVSGGALAAVFGLYERMILFMANITKEFNFDLIKKDLLFFLPVGLGATAGVFIFSVFLSYFFEVAEVPLTWFFVGCIAGTLPALWDQAAIKGRKASHIAVMLVSLVLALVFLRFVEAAAGGGLPLNPYSWVMSGSLIALGIIVPGLSPSNLLLFLQMYAPMTRGIANFDMSVIIPIAVGGLFTLVIFSRMMAFVFDKAYGLLFHAIIGFVLASTILIIPSEFSLLSAGALGAGVLLAGWMCRLETRHSTAE